MIIKTLILFITKLSNRMVNQSLFDLLISILFIFSVFHHDPTLHRMILNDHFIGVDLVSKEVALRKTK